VHRRAFNALLLTGTAGTATEALAASPASCVANAGGITEQDFRDYIAAFNRNDFEGFGKYYANDVVFEGRGRHFKNREEVLSFYREVKKRMRETITVREVIVGPQGLAELFAFVDWPEFVTGPIKKGETILTRNFAWYDIADGKFKHIRTARYQRLK
jgi:hypothetical protein